MRSDYPKPAGIGPANRARLTELHRRARGPFRAPDAADWLQLTIPKAQRLLAYLASRGWLARAARGLYTVVPLETDRPHDWREEPWLVAARAFSPAYVGGWSACGHWGLTDQVFNAVCIFTTRRTRNKRVEMQGTPFQVKTIGQRKRFGLVKVWIHGTPVEVSDPTRTLIDVLDDPRTGGGIRHVADVLESYFRSEHADEQRILEHASQFGNGAVFKRLGYLCEVLGLGTEALLVECGERMTTGVALLDPSIQSRGRIVSRWRLRVNANITGGR